MQEILHVDAPVSAAEATLQLAESQEVIFSQGTKRLDLKSLRLPHSVRKARVSVLRNLPVELCLDPAQTYMQFAGFDVDFWLSDYDDSLSILPTQDSQAVLVWLDATRYAASITDGSFKSWIEGRINALRQATRCPILLANSPGSQACDVQFSAIISKLAACIPGCRVLDLKEVAQKMEGRFWDERMLRIAASPLSDKAYIEIGRELGLRWLPTMLGARIKAIIVDLDNTLYTGVLGEVGVTGVTLDPGHIGLQRQLCTLRDAGIFLAISSKNELTDVEKLFREREDFPLKLDMFSVVVANWTEKSDGIREIAQKLHIGLDAILFVDDNPAELAAVSSAHPQIKTIWAQSAESALSALSRFPGMHRWIADDASDLTRIADIEAVQERDRQMHERSEADVIAYLASLDIRIKMHWNPMSQIARLYELSNKTNQFNLSLLRVTEAEIESRLRNPDQVAITAAVADRLSDSGLVVALHASLQDGRATIEDLCISCRALGRHIETSIVADALMKIAEKRRITSFIFKFKLGPRNEPAIRWLESFIGQPIHGEEGEVYVSQDMLHLRSTQPRVAAKVIWEG